MFTISFEVSNDFDKKFCNIILIGDSILRSLYSNEVPFNSLTGALDIAEIYDFCSLVEHCFDFSLNTPFFTNNMTVLAVVHGYVADIDTFRNYALIASNVYANAGGIHQCRY